MVGRYEFNKVRVAALQDALAWPDDDREASEAIRSLVEKVMRVPTDGKLAIDLYGEIGPILNLAMAQKGKEVLGPVTEQLEVVAGAGFDRDLKCGC